MCKITDFTNISFCSVAILSIIDSILKILGFIGIDFIWDFVCRDDYLYFSALLSYLEIYTFWIYCFVFCYLTVEIIDEWSVNTFSTKLLYFVTPAIELTAIGLIFYVSSYC